MAVKVCPTCGGELYQASINGSRLGEVCLSGTCSYEGVLGKVHEAFMARSAEAETRRATREKEFSATLTADRVAR